MEKLGKCHETTHQEMIGELVLKWMMNTGIPINSSNSSFILQFVFVKIDLLY